MWPTTSPIVDRDEFNQHQAVFPQSEDEVHFFIAAERCMVKCGDPQMMISICGNDLHNLDYPAGRRLSARAGR